MTAKACRQKLKHSTNQKLSWPSKENVLRDGELQRESLGTGLDKETKVQEN